MELDSDAEKMIFVVGNSRSGTTMLGRILGLHSNVYTFGELHFFEQLVEVEDLAPGKEWPREKSLRMVERLVTRARDGFFAGFTEGKYRGPAQEIIGSAASLAPSDIYAAFMSYEVLRAGKEISCEQTPRYIFFTEEILRIYPNALIINMIRDPRDVMLSQRSKWKRRFLGGGSIPMREAIRSWSNYHPWLVSRLWVSCVDRALAIKSDRFMSLRFEDLLNNPEEEVRKICKFAGLNFEREMLEAPQVGSSSGPDSPEKRGINKDRAGGWRKTGMPPGMRTLCEWVCHKRMKQVGYDDFCDGGRFSPRVLVSMLSLPGKLLLAIILNLTRFPRIFASLRRRMQSNREIA